MSILISLWITMNVIMLLCSAFSYAASGQLLTNREHRTNAAEARKNDLWCYQCDTMEDGDRCVDLAGNHSTLIRKCMNDKRVCMVKRFSYTLSNENSTSNPRMWSLERNCTKLCEPGCIVIGERTKLYACTSCCENSLCNTGRGKAGALHHRSPALISLAVLITLLQFIVQVIELNVHALLVS